MRDRKLTIKMLPLLDFMSLVLSRGNDVDESISLELLNIITG